MSTASFNTASGENFEQTVNPAAISANDIPNIDVRGSNLEENSDEAATKSDSVTDDLIVANAGQFDTPVEISSKGTFTLDIEDQPPTSTLHETEPVTIPEANTLKRQRSSDSIRKEIFEATKRPRTRGKNLKALKSSTDAVDSKSEARKFSDMSKSVDSHDKYYLGLSVGNKRPSLMLTSGKLITAHFISRIRDAFDSKNYVEAMEMIEPIDALPMPGSTAPRYTLKESSEQVGQIFALYPYITIRAYEQGLFAWIFHGHPRGNYRIAQKVSNYECGLIECDWQSEGSAKVACWNHLLECKVLTRLEKETKMKNDAMEERDKEMKKAEEIREDEEEKEMKKEGRMKSLKEKKDRKKAEKKTKEEEAKTKREEKKLKKEEEAEKRRKGKAAKKETKPRTNRAGDKRVCK